MRLLRTVSGLMLIASCVLPAVASAQTAAGILLDDAQNKPANAPAPVNPARPHEFGVGARLGGFSFGVGASVRYWSADRLAFQADISHFGVTGFGLTQIAPNVLVGIGHPDLTKDMQVRPYAGGGLNITHFGGNTLGLIQNSGTSVGFQVFIGAELVTKSLPKFGFGGDIGYYQVSTPTGLGSITFGGFAIAFTAHYYVK